MGSLAELLQLHAEACDFSPPGCFQRIVGTYAESFGQVLSVFREKKEAEGWLELGR